MADTTQLLVPMALRAMLVNQQVLNGTRFRRWDNNYTYLVNNMQSPMPAPFQDGHTAQKGIHLHWRLPQALKHGRPNRQLFSVSKNVSDVVSALKQNTVSKDLAAAFSSNNLALSESGISAAPVKDGKTTGWHVVDWPNAHQFLIKLETDSKGAQYLSVNDARISFPEVPNRWLIVRFRNGMTKVNPTTWIVESDYLNASDGRVSFLDPKSQSLHSPNVVTKIGRSQLLTARWAENAATGAMYLRAVGPGDVTFSAYAPAAENVFSFIDTDATNLPENTTLTYLVAGWYANPSFDPLNHPSPETAAKEFVSQMNERNWTIAGVKDLSAYTGPIAGQSIFHGMVNSLEWQTANMPSGSASQVPDDISKSVKVAIGNTSVEALSALVGATPGAQDIDLTLLEALQYGSLEALDNAGGRTIVANKARQARYGARGGGQSWEVREREVNGADLPTDKAPDLSGYAQDLAALNKAQSDLNDKQRKLASLQWTLYARWWKNQNYNVLGLGPTNPPSNMSDIAAALDQTSKEYKALVSEIQKLQQDIASAFTMGSIPLFTDRGLIDKHGTDVLKLPPSLVLKANNAPRYWHPNDPVLLVSGIANTDDATSNQALQCRTLTQIVTGLTINGTTVTADGAAAFIPLPIAHKDVPAPVYALCKEAFFLDPANWSNIAKNLFLGEVQPPDIGTAIAKGTWAVESSVAPLPLSLFLWAQPWDPIFLEWRIKWFPTYYQKDAQSPWQFKRDEWQFNGDDYDWTGLSLNESLVVGYTGRTVLTSHSVFNFENRLRDYIAKSKTPQPKLQKLDALLQTIRSWGIMSQRFSGLHDQFVTRSTQQTWPPSGNAATLVQHQYQSSPDPTKGDKDFDFGPISPTFFPQMGGFFVIDNIEVIDSFGQCISLLAANNNPTGGKAAAFTPIRSKQLTPANPNIAVGDYTPAQFLQQPFGLVQPAQLVMRWVDATTDSNEVGLVADANPVCGWLLPNHLDEALAIYDQKGQLLGELREDLQKHTVDWYPAPDSTKPITDPDKIPNLHLRSVITGLIAAQKQSNASFDNFMRVIDETLWLVDPLGGRSDPDMAVLIGRPLAVVRLKVGLDLEGDAFTNQSWADTFTANDNSVTKTSFALKLGSLVLHEDGLIGYYCDGGFQTFNSVHFPSDLDTGSTYVKAIGGKPGNYLSITPNGAENFVTLLMDPRGSVHGATGIVPVKEISLPNNFFEEVLSSMEITFSVDSLLTSAASIQIPRLSEQNGAWSWISHSSATQFESDAVEFTSPNARLSTPATLIRDGWLRFVTNLRKDSPNG